MGYDLTRNLDLSKLVLPDPRELLADKKPDAATLFISAYIRRGGFYFGECENKSKAIISYPPVNPNLSRELVDRGAKLKFGQNSDLDDNEPTTHQNGKKAGR